MTLEQCDDCLHYMKEYQYWHRCPNCGATKEKSVSYTSHPADLYPHRERVSFWRDPVEWMARRPGILIFIWVVLAWLIALTAVTALALLMDPNLWTMLEVSGDVLL